MKNLLCFIVFLAGCSSQENTTHREKHKKPFIIIQKCIGGSFSCTNTYMYEDANGNTQAFDDDPKKYSIGDTIK